jgi:NAD-specific glutamate dehydrogenase
VYVVLRSLIDSLEKEREELDTLLAKMDTTQNKVLDENNTKALQLLSNTEKEFQALVKEEKEQIKNLEQEVRSICLHASGGETTEM